MIEKSLYTSVASTKWLKTSCEHIPYGGSFYVGMSQDILNHPVGRTSVYRLSNIYRAKLVAVRQPLEIL
jgi:hypothetical protein